MSLFCILSHKYFSFFLIYTNFLQINDLLDLTKAEEGNELIKDEVFEFPVCITEATEPFRNDAKRKGIGYEVIEHPGLPKYVYGDQRRVRQAVANVTANAVQHTTEGYVRIELYAAEAQNNKVRVEIVVQDTGRGMKPDQLDALFRDLEQVSTDIDESQPDDQEMANDQTRALGLGLALVARIVRNMDGQLRLKSEEGKGSRFVIQLQFDMPPDDSPEAMGERGQDLSTADSTAPSASISTALPPADDGEVMLVDRGSINNPYKDSVTPKGNYDDNLSISTHPSVKSRASARSSKSDAERLIDAIQNPLGIGEPEPELTSMHRRGSKGAYCDSGSRGAVSRSLSPDRPVDRPGAPVRSMSTLKKDGKQDSSVADMPPVGMEYVTDSKTPIRPVKVPDEYHDLPEQPAQPSETSGVLFEVGDSPLPGTSTSGSTATTKDGNVHKADRPLSSKLRVLVAEDDPINMKILRKRLEKAGHTVRHTVNGEDCAAVYRESSEQFDVVLMDMQVRPRPPYPCTPYDPLSIS